MFVLVVPYHFVLLTYYRFYLTYRILRGILIHMLKVYYLVLTIIIGLVAWLVTDFARNSAEANDILNNIGRATTIKPPPIDPPPPLPPFPQGNLDEIFKPRIEAIAAPPPGPIASAFNYIVTSTIIGPDGPVAFIVNTTRNEEKICKIGDKVDEWEVVEIIHESATLKDRNGNLRTILVQKSWGSSKLERGGKMEIPPQIANIPGAEDMYKKVMEGKETIEAVEKSIEDLAKVLPPAFIRDFIKQNTGLTDDDIPKDDAKLGEYGRNIFRLTQGEQPNPVPGQAVENLTFTSRVNPDNSPVLPQTTFKPGDRRVYACFQNQGALKGLAKVITRWSNKSTNKVFQLETKSIDPNAPYNFIWLEKKEGWPVGEYELELLNVQTFGKIAGGKFSVVP